MNQAQISKDQSPERQITWTNIFQSAVLEWFAEYGRDFPWRKTHNPYNILIAEVLLRQTQAKRVIRPYQDLIARYPNAQILACADIEKLRRWFKPLGLTKRADFLINIAHVINSKYGGLIPADLKSLEALPGLGIYSARAILCLSFEMRLPMIDESSGRVMRRLLGLKAKGPAYSDPLLRRRVEQLLPTDNARKFNLGLIDIGAIYCRPNTPLCHGCPISQECHYKLNQ